MLDEKIYGKIYGMTPARFLLVTIFLVILLVRPYVHKERMRSEEAQ